MELLEKPAVTEYPIHDILSHRWSPLAFDSERFVDESVIRRLFEAARWSPSSNNEQPWHFIVGYKPQQSGLWEKLYDCLVPGNQAWAKNAPVLLLAIARNVWEKNGEPNKYAFYDLGQSMANLTFEVSAQGLWMHQMAGFDTDRAREFFQIPETHTPMVIAVVGYQADSSILDEKYRDRHNNPHRSRKNLKEILHGATFSEPSPLIGQ